MPPPPQIDELGARIAILGGGGKSTLARALAHRLGVPHIELDAVNHLPGWVERDPADFRQHVERALDDASTGWVADGNYSGKLGDLVTRRAQTVVFVNMPWRVMFRRVVWRGLKRALDKNPVCGDNVVTWRRFLSRDSLWWYHVRNRDRYLDRPRRVREQVPPHARFIEVSTPRELDELYAHLGLQRDVSSPA